MSPTRPGLFPRPPGGRAPCSSRRSPGRSRATAPLVEVEVGAGAALELVTNAATLAYPAASAARHRLRVRLGEGARFAWRPAPLILAAGCDLESRIELELAAGAAAFTRELVVLGRAGELPGSYRSVLRCELDGRPLLHEAVEIGEVHASSAVLGGAAAFASLALLGLEAPGPAGAGELDLDGPGRVLRALAAGSAELEARIARVEARWVDVVRTRDAGVLHSPYPHATRI